MTFGRLAFPIALAACSSNAQQGPFATDGDAASDQTADTCEHCADVHDGDSTTLVERAGVVAAQHGDVLVVEDGRLRLEIDLVSGLFSVYGGDGRPHMLGADARVAASGDYPFVATDTWYASEASFSGWAAEPASDPLGEGLSVTVTRGSSISAQAEFRQTFQLRAQGFLTVQMEVRVAEGTELADQEITEVSPLVVESERGGAFFVGTDPASHLAADDGSDMYFDFAARVYRMGKGGSAFFPHKGSVSNWNAALFDRESGAALVAGFMSFDQGVGLVAFDHVGKDQAEDSGRESFGRFEGFNFHSPAILPAKEDGVGVMRSGLFYLDFGPSSPQEGLELYAERYRIRSGKPLVQDVPSGWNSWGGGSGSGGPGANIDESFILANLEPMQEDFAPFGMKYFLIDDGWQVEHGDWFTNPERFPPHNGQDGLKWLAQEIEDRGFTPGIWIAPFWIKKSAALAKEHPDWFAEVSDLGGVMVGPNDLIPDLTKPEVLDWVWETFHRIAKEWGFKFIKMDFSYYALFAGKLADPTKDAAQAYHNALSVIRDAIGPETFLVTVSAMGLCFDSANGSRLTLDNEPMWGDHEKQGIKVTLLTAAHRYYLNWLWANHPDLLFYRDNMGLTLSEARTWTSMVALLGGIVKLGETYTAMHEHPDWLALVRPLLPIYPVSARPLDMFVLKYPEVWRQRPEREGREWVVLGLFNWGINEDVFTAKEIPEETRTKEVSFEALGLVPGTPYLVMDAWTHECEWLEDVAISRTLPPRTEAVLIVRLRAEEPIIVATSRHLLGGAVEVENEQVQPDADSLVLTATIDQPAGHPLDVYLAGGGLVPSEVLSPATAVLTPGGCEDVYVVSVVPDATPVSLSVRFVPPDAD